MANRLPWFPFFAADFLMDATVAEMTLEQRGAYITLLCHAWWNGSIPADKDRLTTVVGSFSWDETHDVGHWWSSPLTECWEPHPDDPTKLVNQRLEQERVKQLELQTQRSEAGKASASKRLRDPLPGQPIPQPALVGRATPVQRAFNKQSRAEQNRTDKEEEGPAAAASGVSPESLDYVTRCVLALNTGLSENPDLGRTAIPVIASGQVGAVGWQADGVPVELAEEIIRERARAYRPSPRHRQPNSLRYFDAAVREAHERQHVTPEDEDARFARLKAKLEAQEAVA